MRKKLVMLAAALVALAGGLVEVSPKTADAVGCLYAYCGPARVACRAACEGDAACLTACNEAYMDCCKF
jgi:hypothetical protein